MKVNFTGFLTDASGYGEAARRLVSAIATTSIELARGRVLSDGGWRLPTADLSEPVQRVLATPSHANPDAHVMLCAPADFPKVVTTAGEQVGMFCWETDRLPEVCRAGLAAVQRVLVPSMFVRAACNQADIQASIVPFPAVLPPPVDDDSLIRREIPAAGYTFYSIGTWQPRKNPVGLLIAYLTEFTGNDDVQLVIKTGGPDSEKVLDMAERDTKHVLTVLNLPNPPHVKILSGSYRSEDIWQVHHAGDACVSLTRGEAFGLPFLDAMAAGKVVIAPEWGGQRGFLYDYPGYYPVDYTLTPVFQRYPGFDGTQLWAEPHILSAREQMRKVAAWGGIEKIAISHPSSRSSSIEHLGRFSAEVVGATLMECLHGRD